MSGQAYFEETHDAAIPAMGRLQRPVALMRAVALVYAGLLVVGALGVLAMGVYVYGRAGLFIVTGAVLLAGAVVFFWALRQSQRPSRTSGDETHAVRAFLTDLIGSFRLFALTLTGASAGVALAMFVLMEISRVQDPTGVPIFPGAVFILGCGLTFLGSIFVVVDALYFHRTGRSF
ncbi:hypothetical protein ACT4S2_09195 [Kocuria turfanensis]|uniref:hypothetical protein n=1 Tax=Kocuria turfanensis TaxID=388357 RepID=UPI0040361AE0